VLLWAIPVRSAFGTLVGAFPPRRRASGRVISRLGGGTSLVALAGRTRGPIRHSCARPDRRALRADAGGREPGPNFHGARCGGRRCSISDQTLRLDHCVAMGPLPKKCWGGGLAPLRSCNLTSRARLGAVADRNPGAVEVDGSDALREGLLTTPATECSCASLLLNSALLPLCTQNPSWRLEWKKEAKSRERTAEHALLAVSFLVEVRKEKESSNQYARRGARPTDAILPSEDCVRPRLRNREQFFFIFIFIIITGKARAVTQKGFPFHGPRSKDLKAEGRRFPRGWRPPMQLLL
jgi:hypothetical protein